MFKAGFVTWQVTNPNKREKVRRAFLANAGFPFKSDLGIS